MSVTASDRTHARAGGRVSLGWGPIVVFAQAVAVLTIGIANTAARDGNTTWSHGLFWLGLVTIVVPTSFRLLLPIGRPERLTLVTGLLIATYLVKVVFEPTQFTLHDELAQYRTTTDVLSSGHLFDYNPVVAAYPYFPGMNVATAVLVRIGHLSTFNSGVILIGVARLAGGLALFLLLERVMRSDRLASVGLLVYMGNPNFFYFDAQYGYESLALPLALVALLAVSVPAAGPWRYPTALRGPRPHRPGPARSPRLVRLGRVREGRRWPSESAAHRRGSVIASAWRAAVASPRSKLSDSQSGRWESRLFAMVAIAAVVVTHHVASYWLVAVLIAWETVMALAYRWPHLSPRNGVPALPAMFGVAAVLAWQFGVAGSATLPEVAPIVGGSQALLGLLSGSESAGKTLFESSTGQGGDPFWAQVTGFAAVGLSLIVVPFGLWFLIRASRWRHPVAIVLASIAVLFPVTLALRLTQAGTETSNRASEYLYVGIGLLAGIIAVELAARYVDAPQPSARWQTGSLRPRRFALASAVSVYVTVLFVGGFVVGWAPYERQPGPYLAAADSRSVGPEGVQAAKWAGMHLRPGSFIATDTTNGLLMSAYGHVDPQTGVIDGLPVSLLFYSGTYGADEQRIIQGDKISYVVVDMRIARKPPMTKGYFDVTPDGVDPSKPLPLANLQKFDSVPGFLRIYDSGPIVIYSTGLR